MDERTLKRIGRTKLIQSAFALAAVTAAQVVGVVVVLLLRLPDESMGTQIVVELAMAIAAVVCVALLGGRALMVPDRRDVSFTFRFGWWCMAISVVLMVYDLASYLFFEQQAVSGGWLQRMAELTVFCLLVGISEEFIYRGLVFNALLGVMGGTHKGVVRAVIITSLFFGFAHVDVSTDFGSALMALQAVLKIVQTGLYSLLLCVIVLRTGRLGGVSLFHGLDDFLILMPSVALFSEELEVSYVSEGDDAWQIIIFYLIVIALYLPFVIKALRELKHGQDVCRGAFVQSELVALERQQRLAIAGSAWAGAPVPAQMPVPAQVGPSAPAQDASQGAPAQGVRPDAPAQETRALVPAQGGYPDAPSYAAPQDAAWPVRPPRDGRPPAPQGF